MVRQFLLRLVLVAALLAWVNGSLEVLERVRRHVAPSVERRRAFVALVDDSPIDRLVHGFVVPLQVLFVALRLAADLTHEGLDGRLLRVPVDQVTLQAFLQHDHIARRALHVDLQLRVDGLTVVLHVAAPLEALAASIGLTDEVLGRLVDPLDVVLQVIRRIRRERALRALLIFEVLVRQLVLAQQELGEVALGTLVALEALFLERDVLDVAVRHRAMFLQADDVAESSLAVVAAVLAAAHVAPQVGQQANLRLNRHAALVALERNVRLLRDVDGLERRLREDRRKLSLDDPSAGAGDRLAELLPTVKLHVVLVHRLHRQAGPRRVSEI